MERAMLSLALAGLLVLPAQAQQATSATLARIADAGRMVVGFVPDALPLSHRGADGKITGYSIELCRIIAQEVQSSLGLEDLAIEYRPLMAPGDRQAAVARGEVDIECGASTVTLGRREQVDFSLLTLITGASSLSLKKSGIRSNSDLNGKRVGLLGDTTTEAAFAEFLETNEFRARITRVSSHDEGLELLDSGGIDAYVSDQTILVGHIIEAEDPSQYSLAQDLFSFEPYGLMLPKNDAAFRLVIDRALARTYRSGRIQRLYYNWFGRYGLQMSPVQRAMYQFQGLAE
jgi:ABC-type amino acid transport substrate-binding protein